MRQTPSTFSILALFFAFLCFQAKALPFFGDNSLRNSNLNLQATSSGVINLKKDDYSNDIFYVEADLSSSYSPRSSSPNGSLSITDSVKMMVSIVNSETLVAGNCLSFKNYDCSRYNCSNYGSAASIDFPTFTAYDVNYGRGYIYLDYNYWGLNYAHLYYALSCNTRAFPGTGSNRYGVLGLGTANGARSDFMSSAIFSILIDSDQNSGKLLFMKDSKYKDSSPLNTFSANENWQISVTSGFIETPSAAISLSGNVMFDINSDVIGLPYNVFNLFFNYFGKTPNVSCNPGLYRPSCTTTLQLENLPNLTLSINSDKITIPPKIYATLTGDSEELKFFSFNFKAIDSSLSGKSYVSSSFANYVILGANLMSYYYTVFDATSGSNKIYIYSSNPSPSPSPQPDPSSWGIVIGIVVAIVLVGICCYACKKKGQTTNNSTTVAAPLNNTTFNQAPLVYNQQGASNPPYSYDTTNFNYSYPAQPQYGQGYAPPSAGERVKQ